MSKLIEKIPSLSVLILVIVSALLVLLIYVGGNTDSLLNAAGEALTVPKYTDALLYWTYALMFLSLFITLTSALIFYAKSLKEDPIIALKSLIPLAAFACIFLISWFLGSGDKMTIIGYEGNGNEGSWAQFTDMMIYTIYALFAGLGLTIIGTRIYISLK
jgi:hypothetical protein